MPRVIVSGGPGAGKTTLLRELHGRGHGVVDESARELIRERKAAGLPPRPAPADFAAEILRRDTLKYDRTPSGPGWTFFDRSPLESLAMLCSAQGLPHAELARRAGAFSFHRTLLLLPPWPEIYVQDTERDHPFEHAVRVHDELLAFYPRLGYEVRLVAPGTVQQRAAQVLALLGAA